MPWNVEPSDGDYGLYRLNRQQDLEDATCDQGNARLMNASPYLLAAAQKLLAEWGSGNISEAVQGLAAAVKMAGNLKTASVKPLRFTKKGEMKCPVCGEKNVPDFIEEGYSISHQVREFDIEKGRLKGIIARGGDSSDFSDEGDRLVLMCGSPSCVATFPIPEDMEIDWV
jgi:hypothetical protein